MNNFDVGIIGAGMAGSFAALRLAKEHKNIKTVLFDLGRPPGKRRRQLEGWLGVLPNSDGKLYINDIKKVSESTNAKKAKSANTWLTNYISDVFNPKIIKDRSPLVSADKRIKKFGFNVVLNDLIQMYPKEIHLLSKNMSENIFSSKNFSHCFDNEVVNIHKQNNSFVVTTQFEQYNCKKVIVCTGRSGWRWTRNLYNSLGIIENNDNAKFGIRVEMTSPFMKDFNKSNCDIIKDDLEIGPLSWNGTVIPEDHVDMAICSFRSNENRWKSDKVSFSLLGNRKFENNGFEQIDRIAKLTFVLANDRIIKEKISTILSKKSKISIMPEYDWLIEAINEVENIIPELSSKGYFHVPAILPLAPRINIGDNLETEIEGLFAAGESAGVTGLLSASLMGIIAADSAVK